MKSCTSLLVQLLATAATILDVHGKTTPHLAHDLTATTNETEEAGHRNIRSGATSKNLFDEPITEEPPTDFIITCEADRIVVGLDQEILPTSIVRRCTVNSFGVFGNHIALSCKASSSLMGTGCKVIPSSIAIGHDPFEKDVTVTVQLSDTARKGAKGEVLVSASHAANVKSSSIRVIVTGQGRGEGQDAVASEESNLSVAQEQESINNVIDLFLLSGQSNMVGHTLDGQSIGGNSDYWTQQIKPILDAGGDNPFAMEDDLFNVIHAQQIAGNLSAPVSVSLLLANETMKLYNDGLLNELDTALTLGRCSFVIPQDAGGVEDRSGGSKPTVWNSECGGTFGHELTFSRTLEMQMGQQTSFETVKNAHGGTEIHKHWYPGYGSYWDQLRESIVSKKGLGNWKGFIWHQGTQEVWNEYEDTSLTYLGNLTGLIREVRVAMFAASLPGTWQCKEQIPVVVVQIGYWPQGGRWQRVREAQADYTASDPKAELVKTDDLSRFYHFDAPSFLIGGNRIARAYQAAMQASVSCPQTSALISSPKNSLINTESM
mmetsp:Transcript_27820/g.50757  ORF Transcript_27820/g.50757 Transcript_27820/m.50757 type:complete len:546 (+) Transcript_27820:146-1783(+)